MSLTVIVRASPEREVSLTFDGTQRVVIGRGASSDVRLPDPSVSHRHATIRAQGGDFLLVDEGSANGTFVGGARVSAHTSRLVRSGDRVRVGRVVLELLIEQAPATRDVSIATRELALALVARAMRPEEIAPRLRVVEGPDLGAILPLHELGRTYTLGRGPACDLPLADPDASREHVQVVRRGEQVFVRDLGAKNGTWLGSSCAPENEEIPWRSALALCIGKTVISLEEPLVQALSDIEAAPDEPLPFEAVQSQPETEAGPPPPLSPEPPVGEAGEVVAVPARKTTPRKPGGAWSGADFAVMGTAALVLLLSLAGLWWLLRGG
jgi:pSer/pThr/pTyr-binding forkhead associated (FHA) protein